MTLAEHIERQISFQSWSDEDMALAKEIAGNIDNEGFLRSELADIVASTGQTLENVERILKLLQTLNPPGVAARSIEECLQIQIRRKHPQKPIYEKIVSEHLNDVARRDSKLIARKLNISIKDAEDASLRRKDGRGTAEVA